MNVDIKNYLESNIDIKYKAFHRKLIPTANKNFMGVRVPIIKSLAKDIAKGDFKEYLANVSFDTYEETMLCGLVIGNIKVPIYEVIGYIKEFVPHIDNWAVCDSFCSSLKTTNKNKAEMLELIKKYLKSDNEFELRFGLIMLMDYYTVDDYMDYVFNIYNTTVTFPNAYENFVNINHTYVHESLHGGGIASKLMLATYNKLKSENKKVIPTCSYAIAWFKRHPDYSDILD